MIQSSTSYTCNRSERAAGFRHGGGARKVRQAWAVGQTVSVGFLRDLTVLADDADGSYLLRSAKGVPYRFTPHQGIARIDE
jgi:hypothetical protein